VEADLAKFIAGIGLLLFGGILAYFIRLNNQMALIREELATLRTQVSPLWAKVQAQIAADLHHPHPRYAEMDTLLEKLEALTITDPERVRLKQLLLERSIDTHEDINQAQKDKAILMIHVMDMVLAESKSNETSLLDTAVTESKKAVLQSAVAAEAVNKIKKETGHE
jgi:hypothetical protein